MGRDSLDFAGKVAYVTKSKSINLFQIAVNDSNIRTAVVEGLALVAEIICRCAVVENLYLPQQSDAGVELKRALVQLYASILMFLSESTRYTKRITNGWF